MKSIISVLQAAVFFAGLGWLSADWRAGNVDSEIRNSLLLQAVRISQADQYGTFISGLAPVYDPRTGEVLMVVGIDFLSDDWQAAVNASRHGPLVITLILIMVLLVGSATIYWRNRLPEKQGLFLMHVETIMAGVFGLVLTIAATLLVLEVENRERLRIFIRSSYAMAEALSDTFRDISGDIAAIARFKEGSIHVDRQEFIVFAEPMTRSSAIRGYQLAFFVAGEDKTRFESEVKHDGVENFFIWEKTLQGAKIPVSERAGYYPIGYVAPWGDNADSVGFDLGSDPLLKTALEDSVRTGLVTVTGAIGLDQEDVKEPGMLILHPIFADNSRSEVNLGKEGQGRKVRGFAVGVIRLKSIMDVVLKKYAEEEKNKLQAQLAQAQKMEAVGRLAGGVAHDFNNMLSVILGYTEIASEKLAASDPIQQDLEEVISTAKRSSDLVRQLMAFARRQLVSPVVLDLNNCVSGMLKMLRRLIGEEISLVWMPGRDLWNVRVDPSQLDQVLVNLVVNARDAIEGTGKVIIETDNVVLDHDYCKTMRNRLPVIMFYWPSVMMVVVWKIETLSNIFEPFFTTKGVGKGTGLGLATVFGIVKQNRGYIDVSSEPGQGTSFRIYLPRFEGVCDSRK